MHAAPPHRPFNQACPGVGVGTPRGIGGPLRLPTQKDYLGKLLGGIDEGDDAGCVNNASKDGDTALLPSPKLLVSLRRVLEIAQMLGWADDQEYTHRRSCG